jgi:hypothetical protein
MMQQQAMEKQQQQEQKEKRRQEKKIAAAMSAAAASQKQSGKPSAPPAAHQERSAAAAGKKSKRSSHSRRRQAAQYASQHPEAYDDHNNNNGSGLGDTIISTAVHSAIRLKQSPIPDVVKSCLRTSKTIFNKVDERFHLQDKAWELSKNSLEKAIELDEQYAIHEVVTETVFATLTGLVKAGIAYKESPSYATVRAAAADNGKIAAAPPVQVLESSPSFSSSRSQHPQGAQPSSSKRTKSKDVKKAAALKEKEKEKEKAAAAATRSSITSRWTRRPQSVVVESEASSDSEDTGDSDSESDSDSEAEQQQTKKTFNNKFASSSFASSSSSSAFSSASSSCSSTAGSGTESGSDSDNETVELNHETLRPSATRRGYGHGPDTSKLPPPPPYSEQVREKIDMFMALKGAASLLVGSL